MVFAALRGSLPWLRQHRTTVASWVALAAVSGSLLVYAIGSEGQTTHRADLNDGGVWVTNQAIDAIARQNKPIEQLDVLVPGGPDGVGADADVLQDGSAVVSVVGGQLTPVNAALGKALIDGTVEAAGPSSLAGGTIAAVSESDGRLWAARVDTALGVSGLTEIGKDAKPLAKVGPDAKATATRSGAVVAASGNGNAVILRRSGAGFADAESVDMAKPSGGVAQVTAVGDTPVVLDNEGRVLVGGHDVKVADAAAVAGGTARLQQPGPDADEVLVATSDGLHAVSIDDGELRRVSDGSGSQVVAPVVVGACGFAVWADGTAAELVAACVGEKPQGPTSFAVKSDSELIFRTNRNQVVLNDVTDGSVWTVDAGKPTQIADWEAVTPKQKPSDDDKEESDDRKVRQPPQAKPDTLGARATGRATVLHVLDNDLVSGGGVLTISKVEKPKAPGVTVQISPDRQTLALTLPRGFTGNPTFGYTIDDGSGGKDSTDDGTVSILTRSADDPDSATPKRVDVPVPVVPLAASGNVEISVLGDWRDEEFGDPVSVDIDKLQAPAGLEVSATADGLIRVRAAGHKGPATVKYQVSTGGTAATGTVRLDVLDAKSRKIEPPKPQPDVVSGQVGGAITVSPLDNDIPGADPSEATAELAIAADVAPTRGLTDVETDRQSGRVTIRPRQAGRFELNYTAGYGNAKRVSAKITVVVEKATDAGNLPIPAPDTTTAYGTSPVVVDVLANDYDPRGRVLSVVNARPTAPDGGLEVAVVEGRWLRISAITPDLAPPTQDIEYTISNGEGSAKSSVSVTQKPPLPSNRNIPVTTDDDAVVRAGDAVLVPVLDNDSTPSGDPIGLNTLVTDGVPLGELSVVPALGNAYVSGRNVRYVPPKSSDVASVTTVEITYVAQNTADLTIQPASGVLRVQVNPAPKDDNQVPTPRAIEGRVVQGDEITLRMPLVGNDPDGDSVSLVGVDQAPKLGRLLSIGANAMVYQAFPGATGTDDFSFVVQDAYGATAVGSARVAVTEAGAPQAPVAVNDVVTAAPGRKLEIDVLANDFRTPGTELKLLELEGAPDGVEIDSKTQLIEATAGNNVRVPISVPYRISSGFDESPGELQIRSEDDFNNPPVVEDAYATPKGDSTEVEVDVLKSAYDIDGQGEPVELDEVGGSGTSFDEGSGKVTLEVTEMPQVVPFRVIDGEGATSAAVIYVPAKPTKTPYLRADLEPIQVDPGESKDVSIGDLVEDPEGDQVFLTIAEQIHGAPADMLTASAPDNQTLKVTATAEGRGPGSVTFQVSDREKVEDPDRHVAVLTVPVTIGDGTPLVNCPQETITVVEGGASRALDIATICHVWTPIPSAASGLDYNADWASGKDVPGVKVENTDDGVELTASVEARGESSGTLEISVDGQPARDAAGDRATLGVKVVPAGPPSLRTISLDGEADKTTNVDVARYGKSPFGAAAKWVLVGKPVQISGPAPAKVRTSGTSPQVEITPAEFGEYVFRVALADNGDSKGDNRPRAEGIIRLAVVSEPDPVKDLRHDGQVYDSAVKLLWTPPATGGGAIRYYQVNYNGGSTKCPSNRCTITGLTNAKDYTFTVVAHNQYGDSEPSNKTTWASDRVPDAVVNLHVVQQIDGQVNLEWTAPTGNFSRITDYYVTWPGSGSIQHSGGRTSFPAKGLANGTPTTFQVWAVNTKGQGPKVPVTGEGAGKPERPVLGEPEIPNPTDPAQKAVTIGWGAVGPNGPGPVEYFVTKTGNQQVCPGNGWTQGTSCTDSLPNNGDTTSYTVRARNAEATKGRAPASNYTSAESDPKTVEAAAPPDGVNNLTAVATGVDGQTRVTFDVGASHGKENVIHCTPGCGNLASTSVSNGGVSNVSFLLGGLSDGVSSNIQVWTCNGSSGGTQTGSACSSKSADQTTTFGPLGTPSIGVSTSGTCFTFTANGNANGKDATLTVSTSDYSRSWTFSGSQSVTDNHCPGYNQTRNFTVRIVDSGSTAEQPQNRGSEQDSSGNKTTPNPQPPTISNFNAVDGGCLCGGPFLPIQVGISWDTTYVDPVPGAVCVFTMDGNNLLGSNPGCPTSGKASHQFGVPAGNHTFCGFIRLPDGRESNHQCESGTWNGS